MSQRVVTDAIHGSIDLTDQEWRVVDTASFQRLRQLKQLQMAHLTYPNATHTRLAHSLGVFAVMSKVLQVAKKTLGINDEQVADLRLAALLHDVGHYPYSHLMERIDKVELVEELTSSSPKKIDLSTHSAYPQHEELGELIVTKRSDLVEAIGGSERARRVADLFTRSKAADPQLSKLIHSSLDMDRFDFLLRDSNATGVPYGNVDLHYLLSNVKVSPSGMIGFSHKAMSAAEQFLFARFFMYKVVYFHKTTFALEEACRQLLRRCRDGGLHGVPKTGEDIRKWVSGDDFLTFTDAWVDRVAFDASKSMSDEVIRGLARSIVYRRPPALIHEVTELKDLSAQGAEHCKNFRSRCKDRLPRLANTLGVAPGMFLYAGKTIALEPRSSKLTRAGAKKLENEEQDELVKIFEKGKVEPRSLVDIESSITHVASNHAFQFARLYLVSEDVKLVEAAKKAVASWDWD